MMLTKDELFLFPSSTAELPFFHSGAFRWSLAQGLSKQVLFSLNEGGDWQSSSFSGGVFIEKKASPNEWQIWMESRFDAGEIHRSV